MPTSSNLAKLPKTTSETYTLADLAGLLGISYTTAHALAQKDALPVPAIRTGRKYLFSRRAIHDLLGITADEQDAA